jgi:hypothetical protein
VPRDASRFLRRNKRAFGTPRLTSAHNDSGAVCFLWHFPSDGLEPGLPDVIRHTALRSSDFPLPASSALSSEDAESDRPAQLPTSSLYDAASYLKEATLNR